MLKKFFKDIFGEQEGWIFTAYKNHSTEEFGQKKYKNTPQQIDLMLEEMEALNKECSIYFCPHLFLDNEKGRVKGNSLHSKCLWLDKDKGSLDEIKPKPTYCWETSQGRWQAIWKLNEYLEVEYVEPLNKNIIENTNGDPGGWHAGKLLRFPESINHKYTPYEIGFFMWQDGPTYNKVDFAEPVKTKEQKELEELSELSLPRNPLSAAKALAKHGKHIPAGAWELLQATPKQGESWSEKLWKLEALLIAAEVPLKDVYSIVRESPWNKYDRDNRTDKDLWKEVNKCAKETHTVIPSDEEVEELPWVPLDKLMLYAERPEWLVEEIWMQKNVGWIAGVGKSYKSVLSLDLALSIASGTPFLGKFKVNEPGPVLMVQEEDPLWRVAHRLQVMANHKNVTGIDVAHDDDNLILSMRNTDIPLYISCGGRLSFDNEGRVDALERAIASVRPRMVVLDPFFMMSAGSDEFKSSEMTLILNVLKQWRNEYDCSIAIVHHYNKGGGADTNKLYGSMALYAWSENSLMVDRPKRDVNEVIIRRDIKDSPAEDPLYVEFFDIDNDYSYEVSTDKNRPSSTKDRDADSAIMHALYDLSGQDEFIGIREISNKCDDNYDRVRYRLQRLEELGKVEVKQKGRALLYRPTIEGANEYLIDEQESLL